MIGFFKASSYLLSLFGLLQIGLMMNKSSSSSVDNFSLRKSANINVVSNTFDQAEDNVNSVTINPYSSAYVFISENWFATTIAVSYQYNNCRIISYADNLDATEKTLSQYTSVI